MEAPHNSDTIDLSKVFSQLVQIVIENLRMIIVIVILFMAGGLLFYWFSPKTFESKMIIQSGVLSESYSIRLAEDLNQHIYDHDADYLSSKLNLTPEETRLLLRLEMASALSPTSQLMDEKDKIIIVITVRVSDNVILPKLEKGIIDYLTSNEYVKRRVSGKKKECENLISALDRELKMLDTLKVRISQGKFAATKVGDVSIVDVAALFGVSATLLAKKFETEYNLSIVNSVEVIEELSPHRKPIWPKLSILLVDSLLASIVVFSLAITIRGSRKPKSSPHP